MRLFLSLFVTLCMSPAGFATTKPMMAVPELLTYDELLLMTSTERAEYLHQFGKLLAMLEQANGKFEIAQGPVSDLKDKVAELVRDLALMPEANADGSAPTPGSRTESATPGNRPPPARIPEGPLPTLIDPKYPPPDFSSLPQRTLINEDTPFPSLDQPAPDAVTPVGSGEQTIKRPGSTLSSTPEASGGAAGPATGTPAAQATPAAPTDPAAADKPAAPTAPEASKPDVAEQGQPGAAPLSCTPAAEGSPAYKKLVDNYRKDRSLHGECVRGGFFSKYDGGSYRFKGCKAKHVSVSETLGGKTSVRPVMCANGLELCNIVPFCYGVEFNRPAKGGAPTSKGFFPGVVCAKVDRHFTANCDAKLSERIGKPFPPQNFSPEQAKKFAAIKDKPTRVCDPVSDIPNMKLSQIYTESRDSFQKGYADLCQGNKNFRALFCEECNTMGAHIAGMVKPFTKKHARMEDPAQPSPGRRGHGPRSAPASQKVDATQ